MLISPARVYHSGVARFLGRDPLGVITMREYLGCYENSIFAKEMINVINGKGLRFKGSLYEAVFNNPLTFSDSSGLYVPEGSNPFKRPPQNPDPSLNELVDDIVAEIILTIIERDLWNERGCSDYTFLKMMKKLTEIKNLQSKLAEAAVGECFSLKEWSEKIKGRIYATTGGHRGEKYEESPLFVQKAIDWVEPPKKGSGKKWMVQQAVFTGLSMFDIINSWLNPFSETPWCCLGNAIAADEAVRQAYLYNYLVVTKNICEELKQKHPDWK